MPGKLGDQAAGARERKTYCWMVRHRDISCSPKRCRRNSNACTAGR